MEYQSQKRGRREYHFAMVLVLLLAFALGANGLNRDMIAEDETNSIASMGGFDSPYSPAQIVDSLMTHSPNPFSLDSPQTKTTKITVRNLKATRRQSAIV